MKLIFIRIIIPLVLIMILSSNGSIIAASSNYGVFTSESSPYDIPYPKWIAKWWTWWLGIPNDLHPANNYSDSKRCTTMQDGPVWFLPDIVPEKPKIYYNCNVPSGKAILLPLTSTACDKGVSGNVTDAYLTECANNILTPVSNIDVTVDGTKVDVSKLFDKTDFFNVTFPKNPVGFWGVTQPTPGTYRGTATGYFLFLHDLARGEHNIEMKVIDLLKGNEGPPPHYEKAREASFKISIQ